MRRTWVWINGKLIPKEQAQQPELRPDAGVLWGDRNYDGLRATDGTPIGSRTKHREYMKRNGLATLDDFIQHNQREAQRRADFYRGVDPERRADIARAMEKRK